MSEFDKKIELLQSQLIDEIKYSKGLEKRLSALEDATQNIEGENIIALHSEEILKLEAKLDVLDQALQIDIHEREKLQREQKTVRKAYESLCDYVLKLVNHIFDKMEKKRTYETWKLQHDYSSFIDELNNINPRPWDKLQEQLGETPNNKLAHPFRNICHNEQCKFFRQTYFEQEKRVIDYCPLSDKNYETCRSKITAKEQDSPPKSEYDKMSIGALLAELIEYIRMEDNNSYNAYISAEIEDYIIKHFARRSEFVRDLEEIFGWGDVGTPPEEVSATIFEYEALREKWQKEAQEEK